MNNNDFFHDLADEIHAIEAQIRHDLGLTGEERASLENRREHLIAVYCEEYAEAEASGSGYGFA